MKNKLILFFLIFLLVISNVSGLTVEDILDWLKVTGRVTVSGCVDTDPDDDIFIGGSCDDTSAGTATPWYDYCSADRTKVSQHKCHPTLDICTGAGWFECPTGMTCLGTQNPQVGPGGMCGISEVTTTTSTSTTTTTMIIDCFDCEKPKNLGVINRGEHKYHDLCNYPANLGGEWVHLDIAQTGRLWIEALNHYHDLNMYDASNSNCDDNEQDKGLVTYESPAPRPNTYVVPGSYRLKLGSTTNEPGYTLDIYLTSKDCVSCHDSQYWNRIAAKKDWIWDEYYNSDLHLYEARFAYTCAQGNDWFYVEVSENGKLWVENSEDEPIVVSLYKDESDSLWWGYHCQEKHFIETCDNNQPYCSFDVDPATYRLNIKRKSGATGELNTVVRLTDDNYQPGPPTLCSTCPNRKRLGDINVNEIINTVVCSKYIPVSGVVRHVNYYFRGDWFELNINNGGMLKIKHLEEDGDPFMVSIFTQDSSCMENLNLEGVVFTSPISLEHYFVMQPGRYKLLISGGSGNNFPLEISLIGETTTTTMITTSTTTSTTKTTSSTTTVVSTTTTVTLTGYCKDLYEIIQNGMTSSCGDLKYDKRGDVNKDTHINGADYSIFFDHWTDQEWCKERLDDPTDPCLTTTTSTTTTIVSLPQITSFSCSQSVCSLGVSNLDNSPHLIYVAGSDETHRIAEGSAIIWNSGVHDVSITGDPGHYRLGAWVFGGTDTNIFRFASTFWRGEPVEVDISEG